MTKEELIILRRLVKVLVENFSKEELAVLKDGDFLRVSIMSLGIKKFQDEFENRER